eukprot:4452447-Pyramimonas_sp.AAC.1
MAGYKGILCVRFTKGFDGGRQKDSEGAHDVHKPSNTTTLHIRQHNETNTSYIRTRHYTPHKTHPHNPPCSEKGNVHN